MICERTRYFSHRKEIVPYLDKELEPSDFLPINQVIQNDIAI